MEVCVCACMCMPMQVKKKEKKRGRNKQESIIEDLLWRCVCFPVVLAYFCPLVPFVVLAWKALLLDCTLKIETPFTMQVYMLITFRTTDGTQGSCDASPHECVSFFSQSGEKTVPPPFPHVSHIHWARVLLWREGTPVGVTIATLINRTSVDVTWCYQILIKLL